MALAPPYNSCRQSSLSKRCSLPAYSSRGRGAHSPFSVPCEQDPRAAGLGVGSASAAPDLAIPRRRSSRRGVSHHDSRRSSVRGVTLAGRLSVTRLKLCSEVNGLLRRRRRSDGTACPGRSLFLFGGRKGVLRRSLIIQIALFLSAVGCGSPQLFLGAAAVVRTASRQPPATLHGGEERFLSAFTAARTRRKHSENDVPFGTLEVREEAQSATTRVEGTPSSASVASAAAINGTPRQVATRVSISSATGIPAGGTVSLLAGDGGDALSAATAAPTSSRIPAPSQLQSSGSFVAAGASSPPFAPPALFSGELAGAARAPSLAAVPSKASLLAAASPAITTSSNSAAGANAGTTVFDADGGRGGGGRAEGAAALLPGSSPAPVAGNYSSSVGSPVEAVAATGGEDTFRQGPVRERIVRPYSPGPTARAMSFAASTGIPLCHECNSFSDSSREGGCSRVCLHGEKTPNFLMPIRAVRTIDTHPQEVVQLLEANHHAHLNLNKNFYVLRGKGPFGSLGNSVDSLPRKEDATAAARLGLHFPELPHISFAQLQATEQTAATTAAAATQTGTSTPGGVTSGTVDDEEKHEKDVPGGATEHLQLSLAEASVPIMQMKDSQYVGLLGIGTPLQYVEPVFDTGSTNLWVVGSDCKDDTCEKVTRFDPSASSTYRPTNPPVNLDITFGTGRINGCTAVDNFSIGPFLVKDQTFGLVQKESGHNMHGNIFKAINFEGIVGLAFPEMSSTGAIPLYDHLVQDGKLKANEFAFYMAKGFPVSGLFFGGVDPHFFEPPIHMFPVSKEHYWETALDAIYIGDEKFCCDEPSFVILDSGTSFNTLPGKDMRRLMEKIPTRECDLDDPEFTKTYKPITYVIGGVRFPLQPEEYLVRNDKNECKPAFMQIEVPADYGPAYILGSVSFMRHYYTVYRRSDGQRPSLLLQVSSEFRRDVNFFIEGVSEEETVNEETAFTVVYEVGIARAVHNEENKSYLANVLREFPGVKELAKKGILSLDKSMDFFSDKEL